MTRFPSWSLAFFAALTPLAFTASAQVGAPVTAPAQAPVRYTIDVAASSVSAKVPFFGLSSKTARFPKMEGDVNIVPGQTKGARIDVTFDATALEAPDSVTLERLRGEKFFWVEKYPQVRFVGEQLTLTSATKGTVKGMLTARGVTNPATLDIEFDTPPLNAPTGQAIRFTGKTTIDRRKFGMKSYQLIVGNKVKITLSAKMKPA
ncbi:MAG: YceI family protein [Pseudomonadota bacterium]